MWLASILFRNVLALITPGQFNLSLSPYGDAWVLPPLQQFAAATHVLILHALINKAIHKNILDSLLLLRWLEMQPLLTVFLITLIYLNFFVVFIIIVFVVCFFFSLTYVRLLALDSILSSYICAAQFVSYDLIACSSFVLFVTLRFEFFDLELKGFIVGPELLNILEESLVFEL